MFHCYCQVLKVFTVSAAFVKQCNRKYIYKIKGINKKIFYVKINKGLHAFISVKFDSAYTYENVHNKTSRQN